MLLDSQHIASRSRDAKHRFSLGKTAKFTMLKALFKGSWVRDHEFTEIFAMRF